MSKDIDDKGKYFTDVIYKEPLRVNIRTLSSRIDGVFHIRPNYRLLDELNQGDAAFIAVTEVTVVDNGTTMHLPFLALSKGTIEWIGPVEDQTEGDS